MAISLRRARVRGGSDAPSSARRDVGNGAAGPGEPRADPSDLTRPGARPGAACPRSRAKVEATKQNEEEGGERRALKAGET